METKEETGKRKSENTASSRDSSKYQKVNPSEDKTEKNIILKTKDKREPRKANSEQNVSKQKEAEIHPTASDNDGEVFDNGSSGDWMGDYCTPQGSVGPPPAEEENNLTASDVPTDRDNGSSRGCKMGDYCMPQGSVCPPCHSPVPSQTTSPSVHEDEITNRLYCTRAPPTNIFSQFDFDDFPELFKEYQA